MASLTVEIIVAGLIALVPKSGDRLGVLWLDATVPPPATDGCPNLKHLPQVAFETAPDCSNGDCETLGGRCVCILSEAMRVTFPFDIVADHLERDEIIERLELFPRMSTLGSPSRLKGAAGGLHQLLAADADLFVQEIEPTVLTDETFYQCSFAPLTTGNGLFPPRSRQIAEAIRVVVPVTERKIYVNGQVFPLQDDSVVEFLNEPDPDPTQQPRIPARCREESGPFLGRHFELFYDLVAGWPPTKHFDRFVPVNCRSIPLQGQLGAAPGLLPSVLDLGGLHLKDHKAHLLSASARPICTMAVFTD